MQQPASNATAIQHLPFKMSLNYVNYLLNVVKLGIKSWHIVCYEYNETVCLMCAQIFTELFLGDGNDDS